MIESLPDCIIEEILHAIPCSEFTTLCHVREACKSLAKFAKLPNYANTMMYHNFCNTLEEISQLHFRDTDLTTWEQAGYMYGPILYNTCIEMAYSLYEMPCFVQNYIISKFGALLIAFANHLKPCRESYIEFLDFLYHELDKSQKLCPTLCP